MNKLDEAFAAVDRAAFLPDEVKDQAALDQPLPIGFGQTNSQPTTVKLMLEWLDVQPGDKVLDIGSGSGWTTALLARLSGDGGMVYAVEAVPQLYKFGRDNNRRLGITNAVFFQAGQEFGLPEQAPYDRILVSAAADELPPTLLDQLKPGGKLVVPVRNDVLEITKSPDGRPQVRTHPGFAFVPLVAQA
jgi:protein-L-isoaspartate(D-aspartate) O-methyltransferase